MIKGHSKPKVMNDKMREMYFLRSKSAENLYVHFRASDKEYVMVPGIVPNAEFKTVGSAVFEELPADELLKVNPDLEKVKVKEVLIDMGTTK